MHIFVVYTGSAWLQVEPTWKKVLTVFGTLILFKLDSLSPLVSIVTVCLQNGLIS